MFKRWIHLPTMALLGGMMLFTSACTAQSNTPAPYTEGTEYVTLPAPHQRYSKSGKVEVAEVFSYGCIHCAEFAPIADEMRKNLPKGAEFKLVPAVFNAQWLPFARAYYAANQLGVVPQTHLRLFAAKFAQHYPINSMDELANFYAEQGVNRAEFMRIATSPEATAKLKTDFTLIQKWQVDGTPSVVIDGKYKVTGVHSLQEIAAVTQWLVSRELKGK